MNPISAYKHCLLCGGDLKSEGSRLLICASCGHHHYINPYPCNAVIIENELGEILLVERKLDPKKGYWDLPGGFIEPDESFEESVKREIREELNVEIDIKNIVGIYSDNYLFQGVIIPTLGVLAAAQITSGKLTPADDIASYKFFPKHVVLQQKIAFKSVEEGIKDYLKIQR
jgi:NAD+ diphosphatase